MFRRCATPPLAEWDLIVEIRDGRLILALDTLEVFVRDDGTVTAWRGDDDWCHVGDPGMAREVILLAGHQGVPVRSQGGPPPVVERGAVRL